MAFERDIPIPAQHRPGGHGNGIEPGRLVLGMTVGDSVFLPTVQHYETFRKQFQRNAKPRGWKLVTRKVEGGWRAWRVE
jgi:hypothetical protein